jgi:3-oxoacyl-[acyl-carrier protein] reductase
VVPGFINTKMVESVPEAVQERVREKIALGKFGSPEDVANLVLFLSSCERSGYITGEAMECRGMISL